MARARPRTGLADELAVIGPLLEVDLDTEAGRFEARDAIAALLARWCAGKTLAEIGKLSPAAACCGGRSRISPLVRNDPRCSTANPLFARSTSRASAAT